MKKRILALILSLGLVTTIFAGCTSTSNEASSESGGSTSTQNESDDTNTEGFVIGMRFPVSVDKMQQQTMDNVRGLIESAGGKLIIENTPLTPEGNIQAYERLIAAGADAIMVLPAADTVLPRIKEMCETAQIPWAIYHRNILDENIANDIKSNEYYLGNVYEDEVLAGYTLTKKMGEAGCKNIVLFSTALGDTTGELREQGMQKACDEFGISVINEFRAVAQASDAAQSIESVLTTHPEVDGIFLAAGTITPGILPAITSALDEYNRKDIKVTIIDFPQGLQEAFKAGYMVAACGGHNVSDPQIVASLLINKIKGAPVSDQSGSIRFNQMFLESEEDVINYFKYCESGMSTYTIDEANELFFKFKNQDITFESLAKIAEDYSLQDVMQRHKDLVK